MWGAVKGADGEIARPKEGTRPRNPLADLLFSIILAPILIEIESALSYLGLLFLPDPPVRVFTSENEIGFVSDGTFADDTCFALVLASNQPSFVF